MGKISQFVSIDIFMYILKLMLIILYYSTHESKQSNCIFFLGDLSNLCETLTLSLEVELKKETLKRETVRVSPVNIKTNGHKIIIDESDVLYNFIYIFEIWLKEKYNTYIIGFFKA